MYRVLPDFLGCLVSFDHQIGSNRLLPGFYLVVFCFKTQNTMLPSQTGLHLFAFFFLRFAESYRVLPSFTELPCSLAEWNVVNLAVVVVVVVDVVVAVVFD